MQIIEEAKYLKQNIEVTRYRKGKISLDKMSMWQNIEVAKHQMQIVKVAKYRW